MTINQALDKLTVNKELNLDQQDLKLSLFRLKQEYGGNMKIENELEVNNLILYGNKDGNEGKVNYDSDF